MKKLNLVFMGTPDFALSALKELHQKHHLLAVYTRPPKPAGRGKKEQKTPVHLFAEENHIPVFTPKTLRDKTEQEQLKSLKPDMIIVAAYGLILPKEVLCIPPLGCINIHASLLPRWRGAAPIQHAIMAGDTQTGITIMKMDEGMDTGDILLQQTTPILSITTSGELHQTLSEIGAFMIQTYLQDYSNIPSTPQPHDGITYAPKIEKKDEKINWNKSAFEINRQIRALNPFPGTYFTYNQKRIKIWEALPLEIKTSLEPGIVLDDQLTIVCGQQTALRPLKIQQEGKKIIETDDFLKGNSIKALSKIY